jgi:hypothetical protein
MAQDMVRVLSSTKFETEMQVVIKGWKFLTTRPSVSFPTC